MAEYYSTVDGVGRFEGLSAGGLWVRGTHVPTAEPGGLRADIPGILCWRPPAPPLPLGDGAWKMSALPECQPLVNVRARTGASAARQPLALGTRLIDSSEERTRSLGRVLEQEVETATGVSRAERSGGCLSLLPAALEGLSREVH